MINYNTRKSRFVKILENNTGKAPTGTLKFASNKKNIILNSQVETDKSIYLVAHTSTFSATCSRCNTKTNKVKDKKVVYPLIASYNDKEVILKLTKKRFKCSNCNATFVEPTPDVGYKKQVANDIDNLIIKRLKNRETYSAIAKSFKLSISHVIRLFDNCEEVFVRYTPVKNILIDELRLISNRKTFQAVVVDADTGIIMDILPTRNQKDIYQYLVDKFSIGNLETVTTDLWAPYRNAVTKFNQLTNKDVKIIADKFHFIRQVMWDLDAIRIDEYEKLKETNKDAKLVKHCARIFRKRQANLTTSAKERLDKVFELSRNMHTAYIFKEQYLKLVQTAESKEEYSKNIKEWFAILNNTEIKAFKRTVGSNARWHEEIGNSFDYPYSNGYLEGLNQKLKLSKNKAFGYRNTKRTIKLMKVQNGRREIRLKSS